MDICHVCADITLSVGIRNNGEFDAVAIHELPVGIAMGISRIQPTRIGGRFAIDPRAVGSGDTDLAAIDVISMLSAFLCRQCVIGGSFITFAETDDCEDISLRYVIGKVYRSQYKSFRCIGSERRILCVNFVLLICTVISEMILHRPDYGNSTRTVIVALTYDARSYRYHCRK